MRLTRLLIPAFLLFSSQHAIAKANYPDRPIKMTVPLPAARPDHEVLKAVVDPDLRRKLEELGFAVRGSSAEELRAMRRDQLAKYERVITGIPKEHCRADGATDAGCLAPISSWRDGDRRGQRSTQRLLRRAPRIIPANRVTQPDEKGQQNLQRLCWPFAYACVG